LALQDPHGKTFSLHAVSVCMDKVFRRAARKAMYEWGREDGLEDLVNSLWVWYLERPGTQEKLSEMSYLGSVEAVRQAAIQILQGEAAKDDVSSGNALYSSDAVKDALKGQSGNKYLDDVLPIAISRLASRNPGYVNAIESRYVDGSVPISGSAGQRRLSLTIKSLTEEINILYLTTGSPD